MRAREAIGGRNDQLGELRVLKEAIEDALDRPPALLLGLGHTRRWGLARKVKHELARAGEDVLTLGDRIHDRILRQVAERIADRLALHRLEDPVDA
eukprot:4723009-Prymnesium_polylepis.1